MDNKKYIEKLEALEKVSKIPKMREDPECYVDTRELLDELFKYLMTVKQDYGIKWLFGLKRYIQDKKETLRRPFNSHLDRGHIVEVELFGHFSNELTFLHPAVVLFDDLSGWMLIAPISTSKFSSPNPLHIDVTEEDGLKHPCGIALDSIRVIDKKRVLYQHKNEGSNSKLRPAKLDEVDQTIMQHYLPQLYHRFNKIESELNKEREEHEKTKEELRNLQERIHEYEEVAAGKYLLEKNG
ncbi:type II toxin-antitoxin system PemK/MazF family toxin [Brevibacillus porteri]|uniref:type II toxin-antitoxin system PemK/MazF family toxin n=1 Tax=Brevibacillus porteri TaxID=2126350 RepID=UPI003D23256A